MTRFIVEKISYGSVCSPHQEVESFKTRQDAIEAAKFAASKEMIGEFDIKVYSLPNMKVIASYSR